MHELYLAEQVIDQIIKRAQENKAKEILEATVVIPKDEHFTEKEFQSILENQAQHTVLEKTKFKVLSEKTEKIYIKEIRI